MAVYHFHARIISRKVGQSVIATSAWQNACRLRDERLGRFSDFIGDRTVRRSEILLPANAPARLGDREALWNAIEAAEIRKDAQLARQYDLSIPDEFDLHAATDIIRGFAIDAIATAGFPVDLTLVEVAVDEQTSHRHGYLLFPTRPIMGSGFGIKPPEWNTRQKLTALREEWANVLNAKLEALGHAARVDHRSNAARGIAAEPEPHISKAARHIARRENRAPARLD